MGLYIYDYPIQRAGSIVGGGAISYAPHPSFFNELNPSPTGPALSLINVNLVALAGGVEDNFFVGNGYFHIIWNGSKDAVYGVSPIHWELIDSSGTLLGLENDFYVDSSISGGDTDIGYGFNNTISNSVYGVDFQVLYQHSTYFQS
jgi:hypothetical protein